MDKAEQLEFAVDAQLKEVREVMFEGWATGSDNVEFTACLIRAAYARGLTDALFYPDDVSKWAKELGYDLLDPKLERPGFIR